MEATLKIDSRHLFFYNLSWFIDTSPFRPVPELQKGQGKKMTTSAWCTITSLSEVFQQGQFLRDEWRRKVTPEFTTWQSRQEEDIDTLDVCEWLFKSVTETCNWECDLVKNLLNNDLNQDCKYVLCSSLDIDHGSCCQLIRRAEKWYLQLFSGFYEPTPKCRFLCRPCLSFCPSLLQQIL